MYLMILLVLLVFFFFFFFFFVWGQSGLLVAGFVVATISDTFLGVVSRLKWDQR
jgi:hypothetical protein